MFNFLTPKIAGFGIDLSDLSIKIISLKNHQGELALASFGRQEIPAGVIEGGDIKKETQLIDVIKKAVEEIKGERLATKYCAVSLPESESFVRVITLPLMKPEEATEAIKWELEANVPLAADELYYDWQIIEQTDSTAKQLDVLVGVLPRKTVDPYLSVLKKAGLKPFIFEIESAATARALVKNGCAPEPVLIADFGAKRTSLCVFCGQTIYFTTSLYVSNTSLVKILSQKLNISEAKAKEIKLKVGLDRNHPQSQIFEALQEPLMELVGKIKESLDFFHNHCPQNQTPSKQVNEVLLCGGGANLAGLPNFLAAQLDLKVGLGNPWANITKDPATAIDGLPFHDSLAYTTALGLALRAQQSQNND